MKPAISAKMADYRPHLSKQGKEKHQGYCTVGQAAPSDSLTYWLSRFFPPMFQQMSPMNGPGHLPLLPPLMQEQGRGCRTYPSDDP